ncbi:MAG: hypothetical protein QGD91_12065 [Actinomycetota bacterium]|nr:hypothetical protein [Actinomycetota bacterium]MDK1103789.1 hypothetical protein [Actinomycetota bacterium]
MTVILQGERVVAEDLFTLAAAMPVMTQQLVLFFGEAMVDVARMFHFDNIDTQATYDSISAGPQPGGPAQTFQLAPFKTGIDVGPYTSYAPFLEWGFVHHLSGDFIHNPFMVPAADAISPAFLDAMVQLIEVTAFRRTLSGPAAASGAAATLSSIRGSLYSISKFIGDIQVFGFRGLSGVRGNVLKTAQTLGDVSAVMRGAILHRTSRRISGRFASGFLRAKVTTSLSGPGTAWAGSSTRLYNRIAGRGLGVGLRGL